MLLFGHERVRFYFFVYRFKKDLLFYFTQDLT